MHPHDEHGSEGSSDSHNSHGYQPHNSNKRNDYTVNYAHPALINHHDDKSSQSKINHYSAGQEHIVLSSDLKQNDFLQDPIDLARTVKKIPQLVELRPDALRKPNLYRKPSFSYDIDHEYPSHPHHAHNRNQYVDDGNYYNNNNGGGGGVGGYDGGNQDHDFVGHEYRPATPASVQGHRHQYHNFVPGTEQEWRPKKPVQSPYPAKYPKPQQYYAPNKGHNAPKAPLTTPGLKYFASAKPNYNSYFKGPQNVRPRINNGNEGPVVFPAQDYETNEQRQASSQIVESMVRDNDKLFIVPIYANNHHHGRYRTNY